MKHFALIVCAALAVVSCHSPQTLAEGSWDPFVRESLNALLTSAESGNYAVFDFDKTAIVHDVSQALWVYQIEHLRYADAPKHRFMDGIPDPSRLIPGTEVTFAKMGEMLQIEYNLLRNFRDHGEKYKDMVLYQDFRARMFSLLVLADAAAGLAALHEPNESSAVLLGDARRLLHVDPVEEWRSKDGKWGGMVERGIYFSPEMKDLFNCLKDDKIDVYVCSASLELIVEVLACDPQIGAGLPPEQVFGLRFIPSEHLIARYDESYVQPIGPGKVTCIETLIAPSHGGRGPVLVGGDSNGDVPMLTAFEGMQRGLIIDVGRRADSAIGQLIHSGDSRYLVQPAFAKADGAVEGGGI